MKRRGHAPQYLPGGGGVMGKFYNALLQDGHVDSKLLERVFVSCPTLTDKVHFMNALLLRPGTGGDVNEQAEWIKAFGLAWRWSDIIFRADSVQEVIDTVDQQVLRDDGDS